MSNGSALISFSAPLLPARRRTTRLVLSQPPVIPLELELQSVEERSGMSWSPSGRQEFAYFQSIREWQELAGAGAGAGGARGAARGAAGGRRVSDERRPLLARHLARRQLVVFTAPHEKHARLPLDTARTRIMFQCLTNSIGGLGRSTVFNLHCITNRIFSVSVTQCVRKKLCRRF